MRTVVKRQGDYKINVYPILYDLHHSQYNEDIDYWLDLAQQYGSPILELGCGTGRVLIPLAEAGYEVYGLDNDAAMLSYLFTHTHLAQNINIFCAEMTAFNLNKHFPMIILPCNTYSMLNSNQRKALLKNVHNHLSVHGIFAASMPNPIGLAKLPHNAEPEIEDILIHPVDKNPVQISSSWKRRGNSICIQYHYDHLFPNGKVERFSNQQIHQLVMPDILQQELIQFGFSLITTFGDFNSSPYSEQSPYLIILARQ